jgi:hypothetical protein
VTANPKSKTYGDANPALDAAVTGTANGDVLNYTLATTATTASGVGGYPIVVTLGTNVNYAVTKSNATLTVIKAALTVTTVAATKIYGAANPAFTVTYATWLNGDTAAVLGGTLVFTTTATVSSAVGSYDVTPGGLTSSNYTITFVKGTLTVLYRWDGFLQPINDTAHDLGVMSKFKLGQTIPAKFVLKNAAGAVVQQTTNPPFARSANLGQCEASSVLEDPPLVQPDGAPQYIWDGSQYHYNWSTKGITGGLYRISASLADGSVRSVDICLTK